ncbi:Retrovirus-related Pol polyprotein from transposon RE1 [Vitis vinifera]|uniref:Retrovirus-related Pol polyprotein from transposon RE1 n=1 Tax=Vitis vinifera TaxID=29760 RepID=A0A438J6K3_VITVI|nr:Retrovirus-related Pol polyprotein from transposon RE1 [Vitis vinifera]
MTKEKEVQLTNRLRGVKKGTRSLDEYLREFKGICDALAAVRKPVSDLDKVFQLAQGLGTKYMDFRVAMLSKPPYPSYNQFVLALQGHEQMIMTENEENKESINHEQAYFTQRGRGRNRGGRFLSRGRGFTPAGRFNNNATSDQRQNVIPAPEIQEIASTTSFHHNRSAPEIQEIASTTSFHHNRNFKNLKIPQALAAMALHEEEKDPNFYVDSGATAHITNDPEFSSTGFVTKDQLQQVLARGTKKGGLYALEENVIQAMTVTRSSKASSEVWHQRMGHPQTKSIKLLLDKKFIEVSSWMKLATSWKENTANQSSNSKKCSHCPCTTEQRNQFSVEGRISARCNTNQNTEASCVNSTGTPTAVATEISTVAASKNDHNTVVTTETPTDVALGASDHNSHTATTTGTLSQIESTNSYKPAKVSNFPDISKHLVVDLSFPQKWQKNEHVDPSLQNKSTSYSADDEVPDSSKQIVVDISPPQGQHTDNKGTHMITRSKLKNDPSLKSQMVTFAATRSDISEPKTYRTTLKIPHWLKAMQEEIKALIQNRTWDLVPRPPTTNIVGSKWVFKTKLKEDGTIDRYKARLVARGFSQIPGLDFGETFSPVIKHTTIRMIFSLAVTLGWKMRQLDVKNAFLHGFLKEEVFMEQPPGFINEDLPNHVCKLNRSLYGLKQAPRAWFDRLSQCLLHLGFCCGKADSSLFILRKGQSIVLLLIYVDDIIVTGNDNNIISDLINTLSSEFSLKDLGSLHYFLGLEVKYLPNGLFVSQTKYIRDLLEHTKMMECTPINTPMALKSIITSFDEQPIDPTQYRQLVGSLQYLTFTRPDIVHAVNKACQHFQAPTKADLRAVKRILRYLKGTMEHGIRFFKQSSLRLTGFCDADWAGCTNTRRSTSGYCIFLGANCISWSSKRQPTVSRSSAEAEYRSLASSAAEITWLTFLLRDIGIQLREPPQLLCDNLSALHMTVNPVFHARSKHIELDYHFVREKVARGVLITRFLPSSLQVADIFTKALPKTSFQFFRFKLGVHKLPLTSLRGADKGNSIKETPTQPAAADKQSASP